MLFLGGPARALAPVTMEDDCRWGSIYQSTTGVTSFTVNVASVAANNGQALISSMTAPAPVHGFSYAILSQGANATFTISQTTRTYAAGAGNAAAFNNPSPQGYYSATRAPEISTSPAHVAISGIPLNGKFQALTSNPVFNFTTLSAAATVHVYADYCGRLKP